jgi:hypothetical protein
MPLGLGLQALAEGSGPFGRKLKAKYQRRVTEGGPRSEAFDQFFKLDEQAAVAPEALDPLAATAEKRKKPLSGARLALLGRKII